jgi:hypothetical protein
LQTTTFLMFNAIGCDRYLKLVAQPMFVGEQKSPFCLPTYMRMIARAIKNGRPCYLAAIV